MNGAKTKFLRTEIFEPNSCLFFDELLTTLISLASLFYISPVIIYKGSQIIDIHGDEKINEWTEIPFFGITIDEIYAYKAYLPLKSIILNKPVDRIEINVHESMSARPSTFHYIEYSAVHRHLMSSAFIQFFEKSKVLIVEKYKKDNTKWPDILNFGRVIRNSFAHGGKINFENPNAVPVSWRTLTYSPKDNGKSVFEDFYIVELIELFKDIEAVIK